MSEQIHAQKATQSVQDELEPGPDPVAQLEAQKLSEHAQDILDEIDGLLEENAEAFVAAFVQRGGE